MTLVQWLKEKSRNANRRGLRYERDSTERAFEMGECCAYEEVLLKVRSMMKPKTQGGKAANE